MSIDDLAAAIAEEIYNYLHSDSELSFQELDGVTQEYYFTLADNIIDVFDDYNDEDSVYEYA